MKTSWSSAVLVGLSLAGAARVAAQEHARPQGFWIGFGFGDGSMGVHCGTCSTTRTGDVAGYLRLGGTVSQHVLLGGEVNGWAHSAGGVDQSLAFATGMVYWYPSATGAFYVSAGLGVMSFTQSDGTNTVSAAAGTAEVGAGYDIRLGRNFSITPFLNSLATSAASFAINGQALTNASRETMSLVTLGIGLTWH